jgi:hypothetical protein
VQVAWLMSTSLSDTVINFESYTDTLKNRYINSVRKLKEEFINLKLLYISGLHYGGYTSPDALYADMLSEPAPYYHDFAVKATIEAQINGDTLLSVADSVSPWIAWGPNFWADGRNERAYDELRWLCPGDIDMDIDGYHLDGAGQEKISSALFDFFTTEQTAVPWIYGLGYPCFPDTTTEEEPVNYPEDEIVWIVNNPAQGIVKFTINATTNDKADVGIFSLAGQFIQKGSFFKIEPDKIYTIKLETAARGMYLLSVLVEGRVYNVPFYLDN